MLANFSNPEENLRHLKIKDGDTVADLGSGSGHYAGLLAKLVGSNGRVYAVDIQKDLLTRLASDLHKIGVTNVEIVWGDVENVGGSKLRSGSVDSVVVSNILFQVDSKSGLVHECNRILKKGGCVLIIDWSESFGGLGPQTSDVVDASTAKKLFEQGGFIFKESVDAGAHHYGMIFQKA
ncbi:MAG: hypothetical protein QG551_275 [Patescibacteria group bacterium]|jgi:ubiquinone/menaquinone biosynthesis C-methylase UbiE|nr:hypothetical protein [Patescibacteria group bacterium]